MYEQLKKELKALLYKANFIKDNMVKGDKKYLIGEIAAYKKVISLIDAIIKDEHNIEYDSVREKFMESILEEAKQIEKIKKIIEQMGVKK